MFAYLHRGIRKILIQEIQTLIDEHPYYSRIIDKDNFQLEPINVSEIFSFQGRQFPAIVISRSSSNEVILSMDRKIDDIVGRCRCATTQSTFFMKIYDNPRYTGPFVDGAHTLTYVNVGAENAEQLCISVNSIYSETFDVGPDLSGVIPMGLTRIPHADMTISSDITFVPVATNTPATGEYYFEKDNNTIVFGPLATVHTVTVHYRTVETIFPVAEDGTYDDIIPGVTMVLGSANEMRPGVSIEVDTFKNPTYTGEIFGSRFKGNVSIKIFSQTGNQTLEILDLLHNWLTYILPDRIYKKYGFLIHSTTVSNAVDKAGEIGEEVFVAELGISFNTEQQTFAPIQLVEAIALRIELREYLDTATGYYIQVTE